jgi:hypothetical protein
MDRANPGDGFREYVSYGSEEGRQYNRPEAMKKTGGDQYHNNISPAMAGYKWQRII